MSTATLDAPETAEVETPAEAPAVTPLISYQEEYRCPRCEALLPQTCVSRKPPTPKETAAGQRTIQIYCAHCNEAFEGLFVLRDGLLRALGVRRLFPPETADLKAQIGVITGDLSLRPAVAAAAASEAPGTPMDYPALLDQYEAVQRILVVALERIAHYRSVPAGQYGEELSMRMEMAWVAQRALDAGRAESRGERSPRPQPSPAAGAAIEQLVRHGADQARGETPALGGVPAPLPITRETWIDRSTSQVGPEATDTPDPFDPR